VAVCPDLIEGQPMMAISSLAKIMIDHGERSFYCSSHERNHKQRHTRHHSGRHRKADLQSGIAATGMDLLVKTAGVSRKSVYRYFANKEALTVAALQRRDQRWMHWYRSAVDQADTPAGPAAQSVYRAQVLVLFRRLSRLCVHQYQR
jgi:hypothetical protein